MGEPLHLVGAGPVGSLLALLLARRGYDVQVWERRPDMRVQDVGGGRSINLAVSTRGLHALQQVGLDDDVLRQAVPMLGRRTHAVGGETALLRYGKDDSEFINSMSRGELNKLLMTEAERAADWHPGAGSVRIEFQQRLLSWDAATHTARFRDEQTADEHLVRAPVLIATDGSGSALRRSFRDAGLARMSEEELDFGYKELTMPPRAVGPAGAGPHGAFAMDPHALHIWPRGHFMLIALPNPDGSFTCTLFLPFASGDGPSFEALPDEPSVRAFFESTFPDALPLMPGLEQAFLAAPVGHMVTVKCAPWSHGPALLLGDASHAIVPFFGQGMNAGFEDCTVLDSMLEAARPSAPADWASLFDRFWRERKPNTDAIADLAVENFVEMRDKVADPQFLLHKAVEAELQKRWPGQYRSRYQLVTFSRVPYRVALEAGRLQAAILAELTRDARSAGAVDYARAGALLEERLFPYLRAHGAIS